MIKSDHTPFLTKIITFLEDKKKKVARQLNVKRNENVQTNSRKVTEVIDLFCCSLKPYVMALIRVLNKCTSRRANFFTHRTLPRLLLL